PHQRHQRLGGASHDLHGFHRDTLHLSDRLTQTVSPRRTAVNQLVFQKTVLRCVVGEGKDVAYGPGWSSTRSEVEFYVVLILVEPHVEQKGLDLHASTSKIPIIDLATLLIRQVVARMIFLVASECYRPSTIRKSLCAPLPSTLRAGAYCSLPY